VIATRPAGKGFVAAGVGVRAPGDVVSAEIDVTRKLGLDGFAAFSYGPLFAGSGGRAAGETAGKLKAGRLATKALTPWQ
jgi:hypothetical protein